MVRIVAILVFLFSVTISFAAAPATQHWAFQAPARAPMPTIQDSTWLRNPIDYFILTRLKKEGIKPSPEADRVTLVRRLSLDLIGLPPSIQDVDAFLADERPDAYERLVDHLLASPHYGERWGRHWLDAARYADSNGFSIDAKRDIWKYRDWVIDALNKDMPFDQFTLAQIAGDLLPIATTDQLVATGFHRNTLINQEGGIDLEQFRVESVVDRVNTTGAVWLGLTIGCAQCHDHKYDPISQREYYQLFAFFNNCDEPMLDLAAPEQIAKRNAIRKQIEVLEKEVNAFETAWKSRLTEEQKRRQPPNIQQALILNPEQRTDRQKQALLDFWSKENAELSEWNVTLKQLKKREPKFPTTMIVRERKEPRQTHIHKGGDFIKKGEPVSPGVPRVLHSLAHDSRSPSRLDFAKWIVDPRNPLTARVVVNRVWQQYFGVGLVETEIDFGTQGTKPTHPELLDWLACEFMETWSFKRLHRLIVTSATYRQSSHVRSDLAVKDPNNRLLARQNRLRFEAEVVRDAALAAGGVLSRKIGGPSVFPPQPDGVYQLTQVPKDWRANAGSDRYRRGLYTHFWRSAPHPLLMVFDAPDANTTCTRRNRSNTPLQALTLLNDEGFFELANALAARVIKESKPDDADRIRFAFQVCLARAPSKVEEQRLTKLLADEKKSGNGNELAAWTTVGRVLLNLDEFITRE